MNHEVAIAALRLSVIQPAFNGTFPDRNKQAYYIRIAQKALKLPDDRETCYSPGTFSCWESDYRRGGFDALMPKQRSDKGHSRRLDADVIAAIYELREKFPRLTATELLTRRQTQEILHMGKNRILDHIQSGRLRALVLDGRYLIKKEDIVDFISRLPYR